jgi:hypothetical protein
MQTFYITSVAPVLASLSFAKSSAPPFPALSLGYDVKLGAAAFLTDSRSTRIELTEKSPAAPAQQ